MTGKVFGIVAGLVAVIILAISLPAITEGVKSFRTDIIEQTFTVATAVGVTTANISLTHSLWNEDITEITRLTSDDSTDTPVADSYVAANKRVALSGLTANTTRAIEIDYSSAGLDDYAGADQASTNIPGITVGMFILIPLAVVAAVFIRR